MQAVGMLFSLFPVQRGFGSVATQYLQTLLLIRHLEVFLGILMFQMIRCCYFQLLYQLMILMQASDMLFSLVPNYGTFTHSSMAL